MLTPDFNFATNPLHHFNFLFQIHFSTNPAWITSILTVLVVCFLIGAICYCTASLAFRVFLSSGTSESPEPIPATTRPCYLRRAPLRPRGCSIPSDARHARRSGQRGISRLHVRHHCSRRARGGDVDACRSWAVVTVAPPLPRIGDSLSLNGATEIASLPFQPGSWLPAPEWRPRSSPRRIRPHPAGHLRLCRLC